MRQNRFAVVAHCPGPLRSGCGGTRCRDAVAHRTVDQAILPAKHGFSAASRALAEAAKADCRTTAPARTPAFHPAFDAGRAAAPVELGPIDSQGQSLPVA